MKKRGDGFLCLVQEVYFLDFENMGNGEGIGKNGENGEMDSCVCRRTWTNLLKSIEFSIFSFLGSKGSVYIYNL